MSPEPATASRPAPPPHDTPLERELVDSVLVCAVAVIAGAKAERWFAFDDLSLVFMTAVIFVSARSRMGVAIFAAILCFLAYNFFFLEPRYTLYLHPHGLGTVLIFLGGALFCAGLANRLRNQVILLQAANSQAETERLRASLLSSVSHDLRSPLSTIIGSAESLDVYRDQLSLEDQRQLARDILDEGRRLDRYIQNLLDMTRLGQGVSNLEREWIGLDDILGTATQRLARVHPGRQVVLQLPAPAPLLHVNPPLFEQALFNALDNAAKFSPVTEPIDVRAGVEADGLQIDIRDAGPGIPEAEREQVFDMFHSVSRGDRRPHGTGLGLTICRGILRAHGGEAIALARQDRNGTTLRLSLPLENAPSDLPKDD